jgi:SAM-dependent methyltransferase
MSHLVEVSTNLKAYDKVEALNNFVSKEEILAYRNKRITWYQNIKNFIVKRSVKVIRELNVVEVGSGSSALLYTIAKENLLKYGVGIELSRSRFEFAELWKSDDGYKMVENINANFAEVDLPKSTFDWYVVVDNTFTYLYPEDPCYPEQMLRQAFTSLQEGGHILIYIFNYAKRKPGIEMQQWNAFSASDPFSYGLYSNLIENDINTLKTIFIKRDGSEDQVKIDISKVYSLDQLSTLLTNNGFVVEEVFATFDEQPFLAGESERLLIVAKKVTSLL